MNNVLNWLKIRIKALVLTWSDFFLALGFLTFVPFAAFSWLFMVTWDPTEIAFKPWMMIACFSVSAISWGIYFYLQIKKGIIKNSAFTWLFVFFLILSIVAVLVQPLNSTIDVEVMRYNQVTEQYYGVHKVGDVITVSLNNHWIHKMFFCFATILIDCFVYIAIIVFPQRQKSMSFLIFVGICIFAFLLVLATYSYIFERRKYAPYIDALQNGTPGLIQYYAMKSFVAHRVPYGACMMLGVMYAIVLHAMTKKWYWLVPMVFCYVNMIFSYCKTSLLLSLIAMLTYFVFCMITSFKKHRKRNIVLSSIVGLFVLTFAVIVLISIGTEGKFIPMFFKVYNSYVKTETITTRTYIWKNIVNLLKNGWWLIGRGFGTHNHMLYPMNLVNGDDVCPSHSSYYAVLGAGGIFTLLGYLGLHVYFGYAFWKCFKVNKVKTIGLSFGLFAFLCYSFTEGVNYLIVFFTIPLIFYYNLIKNGYVTKESEQLEA